MKHCHRFSREIVGSHSLGVFMNRLDRHLLGMKEFILSPGKGVANITSGGLFHSYFLYIPTLLYSAKGEWKNTFRTIFKFCHSVKKHALKREAGQ